jgi:hypothetical protein
LLSCLLLNNFSLIFFSEADHACYIIDRQAGI